MEIPSKILEIFYSVLKLVDSSTKFEVIKDTLSFDEPLAKKFDLDSLSMIEFYLLIQDAFDVEIDDDDHEKLLSLNDILKHIESAQS